MPFEGILAKQMREVDKIAAEEFGLETLQMMEMAAFQMARLIRREMGTLKGKKVLLLCGKGNNGGDAIACSRYVFNWGGECLIITPSELSENASHHLKLVEKMGIKVINDLDISFAPDIIVDGILGYSIKGEVRNPYKSWIEYINTSKATIFSYDLPSGLDPDDGSVHGVAVKASYTLTLAYPKIGLLVEQAKPYVGELYLGDIGVPNGVYERVKQSYPDLEYANPFSETSLVKL